MEGRPSRKISLRKQFWPALSLPENGLRKQNFHMDEANLQAPEDPVSTIWSQMLQAVIGIVLVVGTAFMLRYYRPPQENSELQQQVRQLTQQVDQLQQQQAMPAMVLNRYRNSIAYIFGIYHVGFSNQTPSLRARISGTGFVVADGMLATNRHVAEPWYGDTEAAALISQGATPQLEELLAFFPGSPVPVNVTPAVFAAKGDLAILHVEGTGEARKLTALPLAGERPSPGDIVAVVGYPMGVLGMVAKSPPAVYERLALRRDDIHAANELAALSLIRPSATYGHLGDVVGDKLIYDAPTAHGGSGGPVLNSHAEVIGINAAYIDGFSGGTLGISVDALRPLITAAKKKSFTSLPQDAHAAR